MSFDKEKDIPLPFVLPKEFWDKVEEAKGIVPIKEAPELESATDPKVEPGLYSVVHKIKKQKGLRDPLDIPTLPLLPYKTVNMVYPWSDVIPFHQPIHKDSAFSLLIWRCMMRDVDNKYSNRKDVKLSVISAALKVDMNVVYNYYKEWMKSKRQSTSTIGWALQWAIETSVLKDRELIVADYRVFKLTIVETINFALSRLGPVFLMGLIDLNPVDMIARLGREGGDSVLGMLCGVTHNTSGNTYQFIVPKTEGVSSGKCGVYSISDQVLFSLFKQPTTTCYLAYPDVPAKIKHVPK